MEKIQAHKNSFALPLYTNVASPCSCYGNGNGVVTKTTELLKKDFSFPTKAFADISYKYSF